MGKTCEPKAFSFQCMTEFTTNKKIKKQNKTNTESLVQIPQVPSHRRGKLRSMSLKILFRISHIPMK